MIDSKPLGTDVYTDFSGFESMRKAARENSPEAVASVAKKLEGMFLNMMLSSMREANQILSEDSLVSSKEVRFYQQMLDQQLSSTLSEGRGMGLAETIRKQLSGIQDRRHEPAAGQPGVPEGESVNGSPGGAHSLERYRVTAVAPAARIDAISARPEVADSDKVFTEEPAVMKSASEGFAPVSPGDFVQRIMPYAKQSADALGVPVESIIAQAALETGWGRYLMKHDDGRHAFNFFGIKANGNWQGESVDVMTLEYRNGIAAREPAAFRSYATLDEAFKDYTDFLSQKERYQPALEKIRQNQDAKSWGNYLQDAGYATDPNYGKKIADIVARLQKDGASQTGFNLTQAP
ncbi:MAG: flagellar assembly peptidoglycan hydrolase FlgJ [Ketobacteraceae bacterium]|nr:flagellar assembly peptidoglycan hydrolase FlgJ [Ketobacteraceae bacterium]